jgi:hypothetical protein
MTRGSKRHETAFFFFLISKDCSYFTSLEKQPAVDSHILLSCAHTGLGCVVLGETALLWRLAWWEVRGTEWAVELSSLGTRVKAREQKVKFKFKGL